MKTFLSRATVVAVALAICLSTLQARAQAQRPSGTSVAVIDLGEVFKEHPRLKAQLEDMKKQIDAYEAFVRQEKTKIETLAEQLKTLKPGTPDYTDKEKEYASLQADLQVQVRQKSREFLEQEAQIRYQAYQEIQQHVTVFCQKYGIQLVIRFSRQEIDPTKPQEVQMGLNRPIVYQNSLDITTHIIKSLSAPAVTESDRSADRRSRVLSASRLAARRFSGFPIILVLFDWSTLRHSLRYQNTIAEPVTVEGFGYWSGLDVRVEFRPAPPHTGDRLRAHRLGRTAAHSGGRGEPRRDPSPHLAVRTWRHRGNGGACDGEPGRPADRQLRSLGRSGGNARLRRVESSVCGRLLSAGRVAQPAMPTNGGDRGNHARR